MQSDENRDIELDGDEEDQDIEIESTSEEGGGEAAGSSGSGKPIDSSGGVSSGGASGGAGSGKKSGKDISTGTDQSGGKDGKSKSDEAGSGKSAAHKADSDSRDTEEAGKSTKRQPSEERQSGGTPDKSKASEGTDATPKTDEDSTEKEESGIPKVTDGEKASEGEEAPESEKTPTKGEPGESSKKPPEEKEEKPDLTPGQEKLQRDPREYDPTKREKHDDNKAGPTRWQDKADKYGKSAQKWGDRAQKAGKTFGSDRMQQAGAGISKRGKGIRDHGKKSNKAIGDRLQAGKVAARRGLGRAGNKLRGGKGAAGAKGAGAAAKGAKGAGEAAKGAKGAAQVAKGAKGGVSGVIAAAAKAKAKKWGKKKLSKKQVHYIVIITNIIALIIELILIETIIGGILFVLNLMFFIWYLLKSKDYILLGCGCLCFLIPATFSFIIPLIIIILPLFMITGIIGGGGLDSEINAPQSQGQYYGSANAMRLDDLVTMYSAAPVRSAVSSRGAAVPGATPGSRPSYTPNSKIDARSIKRSCHAIDPIDTSNINQAASMSSAMAFNSMTSEALEKAAAEVKDELKSKLIISSGSRTTGFQGGLRGNAGGQMVASKYGSWHVSGYAFDTSGIDYPLDGGQNDAIVKIMIANGFDVLIEPFNGPAGSTHYTYKGGSTGNIYIDVGASRPQLVQSNIDRGSSLPRNPHNSASEAYINDCLRT